MARDDLRFWMDGQWVVEPGTFHLWVATSSVGGDRQQFELV
ncbi:MAG: fibronectin type III-like domain-contianing protein [Sphingomonas taxi]